MSANSTVIAFGRMPNAHFSCHMSTESITSIMKKHDLIYIWLLMKVDLISISLLFFVAAMELFLLCLICRRTARGERKKRIPLIRSSRVHSSQCFLYITFVWDVPGRVTKKLLPSLIPPPPLLPKAKCSTSRRKSDGKKHITGCCYYSCHCHNSISY